MLQNAAKEGKKYIVLLRTSDKHGRCYGDSKHKLFAKHSVMLIGCFSAMFAQFGE
jgi:hypothetical protein